jgi:RNA polymerase sigma-70 factor (ECF subfamily)
LFQDAGESVRSQNEPDHQLVAKARHGDKKALSDLLERSYWHCLRTAFGILRNLDDAEDQVQNAFSKAIERLHQFKGDGPFSFWIGRIVLNESYAQFRTVRHNRFLHLDNPVGHAESRLELVDPKGLPEDELGHSEVLHIVNSEIRRLPPLLRTVLQLRAVEQLPMHGVAAELQVSLEAAKSRLARARRELRARMEKHAGTHGHHILLHRSGPRAAMAVTTGE